MPAELAAESGTGRSGTVQAIESHASDADCLARSLAEPRAFEALFDRHFAAARRYLHRRAGRDIADDLAAETFAVASERRASCRASESVLPWLYGIATNRFVAAGRSSVDSSPSTLGPGATTGSCTRDALVLYAPAELSYDEIATAPEVPVETFCGT